MKELKELIINLKCFIESPTESNMEQLKDCFYATKNDYVVVRSYISEIDDLEVILDTERIDFEELEEILTGLECITK